MDFTGRAKPEMGVVPGGNARTMVGSRREDEDFKLSLRVESGPNPECPQKSG